MDSPLTWMHVTINERRAIVHRRNIFDESDGEEDEEDFIRKYDPYDEEFEACVEDDSNSVWWSDCSGYDTD